MSSKHRRQPTTAQIVHKVLRRPRASRRLVLRLALLASALGVTALLRYGRGGGKTHVWIPGELELAVHNSGPSGASIAGIIAAADKHLADNTTHSVVLKSIVPISGDVHDYLSLSKYFWPTENASEPWFRRDGHQNPIAESVADYALFRQTAHAVNAFSLAYQLAPHSHSSAKRKAWREKAVFRLREWFCDEATRMNPRILFGSVVQNQISRDVNGTEWEGVPGVGTKEGVLDLWPLAHLFHSVPGLKLDLDTETCLHNWVSDYIEYHETFPLPQAEKQSHNNHAVYYDVQYLGLLEFQMRQTPSIRHRIRHYLETTTAHRLSHQIDSQGWQKLELSRKTSWDYSFFALRGWALIASQAQLVDIDVWAMNSKHWDSPPLRTALTFLLENAFSSPPGVNWPKPDLKREFTIATQFKSLFYFAEKAYGIWDPTKTGELDVKWRDWLTRIRRKETVSA